MEIAEKKQNNSAIVQNKGVGSGRNTFEGKIQYLPLDRLVDFKNHPFKVEMDMEDMLFCQSWNDKDILTLNEIVNEISVIICYPLCKEEERRRHEWLLWHTMTS